MSERSKSFINEKTYSMTAVYQIEMPAGRKKEEEAKGGAGSSGKSLQ